MSASALLRVDGLEAVYDDAIVALRGVSFDVPEGGIVALLGPNGAGKTTTLKAISNLLRSERGTVRAGTISWRGEPIVHTPPAQLVARGLVQVLEGRHCFAQLTVEENLLTGGYARRLPPRRMRAELDRVYGWFPRLRDLRRRLAGLTSGGEQQMVAIGRALMTGPSLLLLDEPSMGLAPKIVHEIFEIIRVLSRDTGLTVLLSEQNAHAALRYADHAHVLETGRVILSQPARQLLEQDHLTRIYLGGT